MTDAERQRQWRKNNPEAAAAALRRYRLKNLEKFAEKAKRFRKNNPASFKSTLKKAALKRRYGLTVQDRDNMAMAQEGKCAICGEVPSKLFVDHDHDTGVVRALLCRLCNSGIGMLRDSSKLTEIAAAYLRKHGR